ncbi:MAG: relaxase MobL, partial [Pseudoflavonifractor sp.]|nr:relaxase MobL [Pseudoflavonifractor sp.]
MKGVVFKQRYKPVNVKSTPTLNRKHLIYIATRKGAIHNPGCAFGLWGRLPSMTESENIDNLGRAKKVITEASKGHTIYRAILSVDEDTAKEHGLYERGTWQTLVDRKISVLAQQMGMERKDFCWAASMHYVKGHPHVHIMYWDNSAKVRQEFVPAERFEIIAEKVRAEFGYEIYREEIQELQKEKRGIVSEARLELQSLCKEANLAEALNLDHVSNAKLDELKKSFLALASGLPRTGSLKYAYLPGPYKEKLDAFLDEIMKITDFHRLESKCLKLTDEISTLYGNGAEKQAYNREKARELLTKGMGNTVLTFLKKLKQELE